MMVRRIALVVLIALGSIVPVAADGIMASQFGDFAFLLPSIGKKWEQEKKPGLILVRDESDTLSDLEIAVFAPAKAGTLAEIEGRLATELVRPDIVFFGESALDDAAALPEKAKKDFDRTNLPGELK